MKILLLEDDKTTADFLQAKFTEEGFEPRTVSHGEEALNSALAENYDLLIMDIMVPGRSGLSVVEELRGRGHEVPVIFLTAKHSLEDRVAGLQRGADDYLTKPFSFSELLARTQAILRRSQRQAEAHKLKYRDLEIDLFSRTVRWGDKPLELQSKEFALLEFLVRNQGQVVTKAQILAKIWNYNFDPQTNVVDVLVCRLRNKVERETGVKFITTIRGVGYVLRRE